MKNSLNIWSWLTSVVNWHVVVINVCIYFAASGAVIAEPRFVEATPTPPRHERAEIFDGGLQGSEVRTKNGGNVLRPVNGAWVQPIQFGMDFFSELYAGCDTGRPPITVRCQAMRGENTEKANDSGYQCDGYCGLYFSLPMWILALWAGIAPTMKRDVDGRISWDSRISDGIYPNFTR